MRLAMKGGKMRPYRSDGIQGSAARFFIRSALERAVDAHVQEVRPAGREAALERGRHVRGLPDALAGDAERFREPYEVDLRVDDVHADVAVVLGGETLERQGAMLEDA